MTAETDFYRDNVPSIVNERIARLAALSVAVAAEESNARYIDFAQNIVPALRSTTFLQGLMLSVFPRGTTVDYADHHAGAHVELRTGAVTMTSLTRAEMPRTVPIQPYRSELSRDWQPSLAFDGSPPTPPEPGEQKLHALLLFGAKYRARKLDLCSIVFPDARGRISHGQINLFVECPEVIARFDDREYANTQVQTFVEQRDAFNSAPRD